MLELSNQKKYLIWGTRIEAIRFEHTLSKNINIIGFVDNYVAEKALKAYPIYKPEDVIEGPYFFLIATSERVYVEIKQQLIFAGKREFVDFAYYKWYEKKLVYIHGNCHMDILRQMLLSVEEFDQKYVIYPMTLIYEHEGDLDENIFPNIDVYIHQDIRKENSLNYKLSDEYIRQFLNDNCQDITVPNLFGYGKAFYPQAKHNPLNKSLNRDINGMFPQGDVFIDSCLQKSMEIEEIVSLIEKGEPFSEQEIINNFNFYMNKMMERQNNWDIEISDFIKNNYRDFQLFYDQGHPTNIVIAEIARKVLKKLEIEGKPYCEEVMDDHEMFIYPCVERALSLKWKQTEIRKSKKSKRIAEKMDIEEYIREYIWWCY